MAGLRDTPEAAFLALWGVLPLRLKNRRGPQELGGLWDLLPAETRMPNHPVATHQALVSALAAVLSEGDEAVLLSFSVGPVQRFIAQARRLSDLWAASALLSHAILQATLPIVEQLGPDHVVFPVLRRSQLFLEEWLLGQCPYADRLRNLIPQGVKRPGVLSGSLPNRFLAILPAGRADNLARTCEQRLRRWWEDFIAGEAEYLERDSPELAGFDGMAREQARGHLRISWAGTPWPLAEMVQSNDATVGRTTWLLGGELPAATRAYLEAAVARRPVGTAGAGSVSRAVTMYSPNGGTLYGACYESVERLVGSVKLTRLDFPRPEDGLKCTLCGERGVVPGPVPFEAQKALWRGVWRRLGQRGLVRRGEALCGVCWAKRRFGSEGKDIPSTSEIAATPFKRRVLDALEGLEPEVRALCDAIGHGRFGGAFVVPALVPYIDRGGLHGRFARVSGEALLANPREDREDDEQEEPPREIIQAARKLRRAAKEREKIEPPRPYLAILMMDGDDMGKWLSGLKNLPLRQYLTAAAVAELEEAETGQELIRALLKDDAPRWPMTPALHAALSEACAVFSQRTALRTLHNDGLPAFLAYAGGDDVLALTPIGCHDPADPIEIATECALRLRLRFSGYVSRDRERGDIADPSNEAGYVLDPREGLGMAFGKHATASAGLAVFHHRWPLGRALEEARRAEERAKDELGRDALGISILRRSGQVTYTGVRFDIGAQGSAVRAFQSICHAFAFGDLSPRFVAEIRHRLAQHHGGLHGDELMDLAFPLVQEAAEGHYGRKERSPGQGPEGDGKEGLVELLKAIEQLARAVPLRSPTDKACYQEPAAGSVPPDLGRLERWLDLIEAAAFLGRGEEP